MRRAANPIFQQGVLGRSSNSPMVEFRCGKMKVDANGTTVRADPRKGRLTVKKSPEDDLMHLTWTDRSQGLTEDDFIIFPGDAVFEYVQQAKDNAKNNRVYVLKFTSTRKLHFYWMQEPSDEKDGEYAGKVNAYINGESDPSAPAGTNASIGQADQAQMLAMLTQGRQRPSESEAAGEAANNESAGASSEGGGDAGSAQREEGEGSAESAGPQDKMDVDESQQPK